MEPVIKPLKHNKTARNYHNQSKKVLKEKKINSVSITNCIVWFLFSLLNLFF